MKKAYHKLALQLHPDKNPGDEVCPELAQAKAYYLCTCCNSAHRFRMVSAEFRSIC